MKDFAVENAKSARAFLKDAGCQPRDLSIVEIGDETEILLKPLREGRSLGLLSEAGCPAIADPGATLVEAAHREGFRVVPLVGPSSIVLALMASGLEGQRFAFCGYLPREAAERKQRIKELEGRSRRENETEIFIETPYRNEALLEALLSKPALLPHCSASPRTSLCRARRSRRRTIAEWRRKAAPIGRRPAVFLLLANPDG